VSLKKYSGNLPKDWIEPEVDRYVVLPDGAIGKVTAKNSRNIWVDGYCTEIWNIVRYASPVEIAKWKCENEF
jgi:hypothetical protein